MMADLKKEKKTKKLNYGDITAEWFDDSIDVKGEKPKAPKNTKGYKKVWSLAEVYVYKKGKGHKIVENQVDRFAGGLTFTVPIPEEVFNDPIYNPKHFALVFYDKKQKEWIDFKEFEGAEVEIKFEKKVGTVTLEKWIKDPPIGWGGTDPR